MVPKRDQGLAKLPVQAIDMAEQPFLQIAQDQTDAGHVPVHLQVLNVVQQAAMFRAVSREVGDLVLLHQALLGREVECREADQLIQAGRNGVPVETVPQGGGQPVDQSCQVHMLIVDLLDADRVCGAPGQRRE